MLTKLDGEALDKSAAVLADYLNYDIGKCRRALEFAVSAYLQEIRTRDSDDKK